MSETTRTQGSTGNSPHINKHNYIIQDVQGVAVSGSKPVWSTGAVALVNAAVPTEIHAACLLTAVCLLSAESVDTVSFISEDVHDPPPPIPLMFLPLILNGTTHFALLDSCAYASFIGADVVNQS